MSRESDSPSSSPQGRGGAAYPSGTPPYGTPRGNADEAAGAAQPEEQKTETTLTTRIKINIPGSRPIPPVVVRTPVGEEPSANGSGGGGSSAAASGASASLGAAEPGGERTGSTPRPGSGPDRKSEAAAADKTSDWFAPRKSPAAPGPSGAPAAPGPSAPSGGAAPANGTGEPKRPDLPYFSDGPAAPGPSPFDLPGGESPFDRPAREAGPFDRPVSGNGAAAPQGPSGPTTGPVTGDMPLDPAPGYGDAGQGPDGLPRMSDDTAVLTPQPPASPQAGPGSGIGVTGGISGGLPGGAGQGAGPGNTSGPGSASGPGNVSGDTLTSGIPTVPAGGGPAAGSPFPPGPAAGSQAPKPRPKIPEPINPPKKKGRNKIVLLGAAVVVLAGVAYGAGLVLDHADVPNGTTALGVDIGGTSKDEAVKKLDTALKDRLTAPLKLTVDGKEQSLSPAQAGLSVDTKETVNKAAGRDYNPVSVIGSLFGGTRIAPPAMLVDEEKLDNALQAVAGADGAVKEGGITFENGQAVAHYGTPYKAVDAKASKSKVEQAYRDRVATGKDTPVVLAAKAQQPKVSKAAVDKAMEEIAKPAMSGLIVIQTDPAHRIPFSPQKSIPKFLSVKANPDGTLALAYDRAALKELYGDTFNGVMVTRGDGSKHPVSVEEVAGAVTQALRGKTLAERTVTIPTNGS